MSDRLFDAAADTSLDAMYILKAVRDSNGRIKDFIHEYANRSTFTGISITPNELIGKSVLEISPQYLEVGLFDDLRNVVETGQILKKDFFESNLIDNSKFGIYNLRASKWNDGCILVWHDMTDYVMAINKLEAKRLRSDTLLKISEELAEADLNYTNTLNIIAEKAATLIGDVCIIGLISDEKKFIRYVALFQKNEEARNLLKNVLSCYIQSINEGLAGQALSSGSTIILPETKTEDFKKLIPESYWAYFDRFGVCSIIVSPMKAHGNTLGVISLLRNIQGKSYTNRDREFLEEIGVIAALSISNAHLFKKIIEEKDKLHEALRELEISNKELQMFSYAISHDLQEPVRMIANFAKLIETRYSHQFDENTQNLFRFITDSAIRLQKMILGILDFSRVYTRGARPALVDLNDTLKNTLFNLRLKIEETNTMIKSDHLPVVEADEIQIGRVFQSIIENAIKYKSAESPRIHITCKKEAHEWIISIKDNGIGISQKNYERIFTLFQRLQGIEYEGLGVGLAISKRIIERHNGKIWVESEPGKGAIFHFSLPRPNIDISQKNKRKTD